MLGFEKLATRKGKETLAMKKALQVIAGTIAGLAVVFGLVIAVEIFSNWVHPLPPESEYSMEIMCAHVAAYPYWVLAAVVPMWGATAFAGVWVGGRIHRPLDGIGNRGGTSPCRLGFQRVDAALHALAQRRDADGGNRQPRPRRVDRVQGARRSRFSIHAVALPTIINTINLQLMF
jgi:hypothetical protein